MSRMSTQIRWMTRGQARTTAAFESLSADLRALQQKVDVLEATLARIDRRVGDDIEGLRARQLDEFDSVRIAVAAATDDLSARIGALQERR